MIRASVTCAVVVALVIAPPALVAALRRRRAVPWTVFLFGVCSFVLSQVVHLPLLWALGKLSLIPTGADTAITPARALVLGLAAGLCEETLRLLLLRRLPTARSGSDALAFGLGHGGIEAMLLGGVLLAAQWASMTSLQHADLAALATSAEKLSALQQRVESFTHASAWFALVPLLERVLALGCQLSQTLMVIMALRTRRVGYFLAAVAYHTGVDGLGVLAASHLSSAMEIEGVVAALISPGVIWMLWRLRGVDTGPARSPASFKLEWSRFVVLLKEELLRPIQTRSAAVVPAALLVSVALGSLVPLIVEHLPAEAKRQMAAQGADKLIPPDPAAFALQQVVKTEAQLAFLAVVILAALAVARDRQRGALALLLSKPVPRWAVVLSKAAAQVLHGWLGLAAACAIEGVAVSVLFHAPDLRSLLSIHALMALWLATWVALGLAASCAARSEGGAIGVAALTVALVIGLGAIPTYGAIFPSGLTQWAHEIACGTEVHVNAGALAMALVLIELAIIVGIERLDAAEV